jgi:hypothetical protein
VAGLDGGIAPVSAWPHPARTVFLLAGAAWGGLALILAPLTRLWRTVRRRPPPGADSVPQGTALLGAFVLLQGLFVIVLWDVSTRLSYPTVIPAWALGWCLLSAILCGCGRGLRALRIPPAPAWAEAVLTGALCLAAGVGMAVHGGALHARQLAALATPPPTEPTYPPFKALAEQLAKSYPENAVLLCSHRKAVLWYAPDSYRSCGLPYAVPGDLLAVARFYGVTHIVQDWAYWRVPDHVALVNLLRRNPRAFEPVVRHPFPTYRIHWDRVPEDWITPLERLKPYWNPATDMRDAEARLKAATAEASRQDEAETRELGRDEKREEADHGNGLRAHEAAARGDEHLKDYAGQHQQG